MSWGAMMGLGQGLQQVGGMMLTEGMNNRKTDMLEKLKIEEERRAEQRQIERERRAQERLDTTMDPSATRFMEKDGAMFEQRRSATGKVLEEVEANPYDVKRIQREQEQADALARGRALDVQIKEGTLANQSRKFGLEAELTEARIGQANRANTPESRGGGSAAQQPTKVEVEDALAKRYKPAFDSLANEFGRENVRPEDYQRIVNVSVEEAIAERGNAEKAMQAAFEAWRRELKERSKAGSITVPKKKTK